MIIGGNRDKVIENIRCAAESGDFYAKVEVNDPVLSSDESREIVLGYLADQKRAAYRVKKVAARAVANVATRKINKTTEIIGDVDESVLEGGVIITSNHFGPLENTVIRHFTHKHGKRLNVVSQVTNFAMDGFIGFLMNYADTIPLPTDPHQLVREFLSVLDEKIGNKEAVLIYPEQEMWFNYRKPRPPKAGAYYFAAKLGCPIISCFVEIVDEDEKETDEFYKTAYRLHILGVLRPDPDKSLRDNTRELCEKDYALKKSAYEKCYGKPLSYTFSEDDIAGLIKS